jgi:hypothetical protein
MNDQIRKLVIKSGIDIRGHLNGNLILDEKPSVADLEFLVKKVIEECARVCLDQRDPSNLNYKPSERFAEAIKEHFGVK